MVCSCADPFPGSVTLLFQAARERRAQRISTQNQQAGSDQSRQGNNWNYVPETKSINKTALGRAYNGQIAAYAMCLCTCAWPCVRSNIALSKNFSRPSRRT